MAEIKLTSKQIQALKNCDIAVKEAEKNVRIQQSILQREIEIRNEIVELIFDSNNLPVPKNMTLMDNKLIFEE